MLQKLLVVSAVNSSAIKFINTFGGARIGVVEINKQAKLSED